MNRHMAPIPSLPATAEVHHRLIRECLRNQCGQIIETGEALVENLLAAPPFASAVGTLIWWPLRTVDVEFVTNGQGRTEMREVADTDREWPAELVLLALGFSGPEPNSIVWAISEGREAAHCVDKYLTGTSMLPAKGGMDLPRI